MDYKQWAEKYFSGDIFALETTGIVIEAVDKNYAKCSLCVESKHMNANNCVMGGAIFTLADFTMAIAANAGNVNTVSLGLNINYVNAGRGPKLFAEARCVKDGFNVGFYEITVTDTEGKIVAVLSGSGFCKH